MEAPVSEASVRSPWQGTEIDTGVAHPCLSNLIVYTEEASHEKTLGPTIAEYVARHPCRVILIHAQPRSSPAKLEAVVQPHTNTIGGSSVTCDQITLRATGSSVKDLASAVQPLLVPDLPINIWWRGMFLNQRPLVEQMLVFADRFIYDGAKWSNLHYTVLQVADLIQKWQDKVGFTNFNWSRLRPWRENTADFFDRGLFEQDIWNIRRVRVEFMSVPGFEEGNQYRALMYVAWLAVQLEWTPVRGMPGMDVAQIQFTDKRGQVIDAELALMPQSSAMSQSIQKIIIGSEVGGQKNSFTLARDHERHLIDMSVNKNGAEDILRRAPHADSTKAELLHREMGRRVRNRVFERSFKMASELLQTI